MAGVHEAAARFARGCGVLASLAQVQGLASLAGCGARHRLARCEALGFASRRCGALGFASRRCDGSGACRCNGVRSVRL